MTINISSIITLLTLKKYLDFLQAHPITYDFMLKAKSIWEAIYEVVKNILENFEPNFPGTIAKIFNTDEVHLLHYRQAGMK